MEELVRGVVYNAPQCAKRYCAFGCWFGEGYSGSHITLEISLNSRRSLLQESPPLLLR